jgi:hypothetical protein
MSEVAVDINGSPAPGASPKNDHGTSDFVAPRIKRGVNRERFAHPPDPDIGIGRIETGRRGIGRAIQIKGPSHRAPDVLRGDEIVGCDRGAQIVVPVSFILPAAVSQGTIRRACVMVGITGRIKKDRLRRGQSGPQNEDCPNWK